MLFSDSKFDIMMDCINSFFSEIRLYFKNWDVKLKLKRGNWYDTDTIMEKAIVALFIEFVEKECDGIDGEFHSLIFQSRCEEYTEEKRIRFRKLIDAYYFFKDVKDTQAELDHVIRHEKNWQLQKEKMKILDKMIEEQNEQEKYHLDSIWNNRGCLWT